MILMENDFQHRDSADTMGADNENILRAKKQSSARAAASRERVSAGTLKSQMQKNGEPARQNVRRSTLPNNTAASAPSRPSAARPSSTASAPTSAQKRPVRNPRTLPAKPGALAPSSSVASPGRSGDLQLKTTAKPTVNGRSRREAELASAPTRITDMTAVRKPSPDSAPTRLMNVSSSAKVHHEKIEEKGESEGRNTIVSIVKAITYIVFVLVVSVFLSLFIILVGNDIYALVKDDTEIEISIPEYASLNDVTEILYNNGVIEYPNIFKLYATYKKDNGQFLAGTYTISPMMNYDELLYEFKEKMPTGTSLITIPEGYTTDEIIDLLVSYGIGTREGYVEVINHYDFDYWFIDALEQNGVSEDRYYRLDGYLFPDTYEFYNASSEEVVINKLLKRFNQVFIESYTQRAETQGYTVDEILIIASMIEKEAANLSEFFTISSVFNNRLLKPSVYPYLESDATIVYAIAHDTGVRKTLTPEDTTYDSAYNTYTHQGLPPGPIANPSASAIRAALYPSDTNYYYFYSPSSNLTLFAETWEEHRKNIATGGQEITDMPQE